MSEPASAASIQKFMDAALKLIQVDYVCERKLGMDLRAEIKNLESSYLMAASALATLSQQQWGGETLANGLKHGREVQEIQKAVLPGPLF